MLLKTYTVETKGLIDVTRIVSAKTAADAIEAVKSGRGEVIENNNDIKFTAHEATVHAFIRIPKKNDYVPANSNLRV